VVLAGPAGVGKSRLARECVAMGEPLGLRCARVFATAAASAVPLGALAQLVPDEPGWAGSPGDELGWVVERIRGDGGPLLVVVDDAHLLDDASATVVHRVVRDGGGLLVLTARTESYEGSALATLCRGLRVERIDVGPLGRDEVVGLAAAVLGGPVDGSCGHDLWVASRGNPLFLRELLLGALAAQVLRSEDGLWRLSGPLTSTPRLAELIRARMADLDEPQRGALQLLALGEPLGSDVLAALGVRPAQAEELEVRGLVVSTVDGEWREVRLAHPTYAEMLRDDLTAMARLSTSRRLADTFEAAGVRPGDVLRVAVWRLEGGGAADPGLMLEGARRAYFARQTDLAERLAREAIEAGVPMEAGALLAQVLGNLGRHDERYDLLRRLESAAPTQELHAMVTMERALAAFWGLNRGDEAHEALAGLETGLTPGPWRDEVTAQRATLELMSGRPRQALALATPLLLQDGGRAMVTAAIAAAPALAISGRGDEAVGLADRAVLAHLDLGEQEVLSNAGIHVVARALGLTESGRLDEADTTLTVGYDISVGGRNAIGRAWCALLRGRLALVTGQLGAASRWFREGAAAFADLAQDGPRRWCVAGLALAAGQRADHTAAGRALAELDAIGPNCMQMMEPDVVRARAWEAAARPDPPGARRLLVEAAALAESSGTLALAAAAWHDLARLGHAEPAAAALAAISPAVEGDLVPARAAHAAALADHDAAGLEAAADRFEAMGALLPAAEAAAAASAELRRAQRARRAAALGRRSAALAARCQEARTPALGLLGRAGDLTGREREVAQLAARGLPSGTIAERLHVSVRTIESHLLRVYAKLGISSRDGLAAALDPGGPGDPGSRY
jgi:DNA-binding CsgD family transcriptional regulator